jgi:tetrahydromethanopterin S-methyltransferase subunit G
VVRKAESGKLLRERRKKLKIDARVVMDDDEYRRLCERLDRAEI